MDPTPIRTGPVTDPEHCLLPAGVMAALGIEPGTQVRLERGDRCALFTVTGTDDSVVVSEAGLERLGLDGHDAVRVSPTVFVADDGPFQGRFEEEVIPGGDRYVACAPHGGLIEPWTNRQARIVAEEVGATAWVCRGKWEDGGSFDRWHITAKEIHPDSFPGLASILDRGFDLAVAFHGWDRDGIGIGGRAPAPLRRAVRDAVSRGVDSSVPVHLETTAGYAGKDPNNVVNRLTTDGRSGVQLEQSERARDEYADDIAAAVADVLSSW